jgi:ABC-type proline/glycine betaine transport system substrate-binding protein
MTDKKYTGQEDWNDCLWPDCKKKARHQGGSHCKSHLNKMWNEKDPNYTKLIRQLQYARRRDKILAYQKQYQKDTAEKRKAYAKEYRERNAELLRQKRRERKFKASVVSE